jgi:cysteinyl-tRNA synthetase
MAERKQAEELKRKEELLQAQKEKDAKKSIPPNEMFLKETEKYSKFDEKGFPLLDAEGKELSKGLTKKLQKLYDTQVKTYEDYLKSKLIEN